MAIDPDALFSTTPPHAWPDVSTFVDALPAGSPADRAFAAGLHADRVGYAFIGGYHAACDALMAPAPWPAMCVTESGPPHPRTIACRWADGALTGTKTFVTGGPLAKTLHILAVAGDEASETVRPLVVATVDAKAPGVTIEPLPASGFVPEVPHGRVVLAGARPATIVEDGWARVVKPFRTVEDIHVTLAVLVYLTRAAHRHRSPPEDIEALAGLVHALHALSTAPSARPGTHLALAGLLTIAETIWPRLRLEGEEGERWDRDQRLLTIARKARLARLEAARSQVAPAVDD